MSALFFDIDGTILSEITHKIPESALEALRKAQENGQDIYQYRAYHMQCTTDDKEDII